LGGITVVFGGDLRQILPVIPRACPEEIRSSILGKFWESITLCMLNKNMRLSEESSSSSETAERINFSKFILEVGEGKVPENI
jgi:hypothetical protein